MSSASYIPIVCLFLLATAFLNGAHGKPMPAEQNEQQQQQKAQPQSNGSSSPSPLEACLQKISSTVCDPNGVLNAEQTQKLNDALAQMSKQTQQEGYAFDKSQREKCGQQGITMPVVILKEASQDLSATEKQLIGMNKEWTQQNPCDRVTIMMINAGDKVEQRRFWAGRNWNVNVDPSELVKMYQNEVENIKKADYVQALINIVQQFITTASKRSGPPADPKAFQQKVQPVSAAAADQPQQQQPQNDGESMVKAEGSSATNAANTAEQNKSEGAANAESKLEAKAESKSEQPEKC